jgi:hypothetical protein
MKAQMNKAKLKGFLLLRDKNGKPKIDGDPRNLPQGMIDLMTQEEFDTALEEYLSKE